MDSASPWVAADTSGRAGGGLLLAADLEIGAASAINPASPSAKSNARWRWLFGVTRAAESTHLLLRDLTLPQCLASESSNHVIRLTAVHPLSIWSTGLSPVASSNPVYLRHPRLTVYRCSLPGLTGFAASRRAGPSYQRRFPRTVPAVPRPRAGIRPRCSGLRVQGTASSPSSTTASHPTTAPNGCVKMIGPRRTTAVLGVFRCYVAWSKG